MTEFKPGDKVLVAGVVGPEGSHVYVSTDGSRSHHIFIPDADVTPAPEPAVPYTDPRKGDKVALTLTGTLTGQSPCDEVDHSVEADCVQLWEFHEDGTDTVRRVNPAAFGDGRVTLIERAAAPQYQPGRIYRDADGDLWFRTADEAEPGWLFLSFDGQPMRPSEAVPANPVLCDVVPAGLAR